jgi:uncharacterized membrane protein YkvA (DUF1232 family)
MTQRNEVSTSSPSATPVNNEGIQEVLENPQVQAVAKQTENVARIQEHFGPKSEKLRSKLGAAWADLRDAYRMSFDKSFNLEPKVRGMLLVALLYLVVPIDLIPDPIPVVGIADDVALIVAAVRYAKPEIERYRKLLAEREQGSTKA